MVDNPCPWDLNGDGVVDEADTAILSAAYGSRPGDANWNPACDFNGDGVVSFVDAVMLGGHYGPCPGGITSRIVSLNIPNGATLKVGGVEVL